MALLVGLSAVLVSCSAQHTAIVTSPPSKRGTELPIRFVWNLPVVDLAIMIRLC